MSEQWWRDPVDARRVARWSFPAICLLGAYAAIGPLGGLIGFQMHVGPPMRVEFRNIWLKTQ